MGCDIHATVERKKSWRTDDGEVYMSRWLDAGDPDIGRNYEMFAVLAGVRNSYEVDPVAEPKGMPGWKGWHEHDSGGWGQWGEDAPHYAYQSYFEGWRHDEHSASWLSLAEMKAFDTTQTINDPHLIIGRDEAGKVSMLAGWTSGEHEGPVGERRVFVWPDADESEPTAWDRLVAYMESIRAFHDLTDEEVRLVFFFDN